MTGWRVDLEEPERAIGRAQHFDCENSLLGVGGTICYGRRSVSAEAAIFVYVYVVNGGSK